MDFARFAQLFRRGCLGSTKVEPTTEVLEKKHLRALALIEAGELATVQKQDGYAYVSGRNWSIDQTQAAASRLARANAVGEVAKTVAEREAQANLFFSAMEEIEHSFIGRPPMMEGAECLRRLVGGESVDELCKEFSTNRDALYQRVSRVRKAVLASGRVKKSDLPLLFAERSGNFRSALSYERETDKLKGLSPRGCILHLHNKKR